MSRQSKRVLKNWLISSQSIDIKQKYQTLRKTRLIVRSSPMSFHALYSKTGNYVDWRVVHSIAQLAVKSFDSKHFNLPLLKTKITNSTAICDWHWCILHRIWSGVDINWVNKKNGTFESTKDWITMCKIGQASIIFIIFLCHCYDHWSIMIYIISASAWLKLPANDLKSFILLTLLVFFFVIKSLG